jgi:hypothetical protein
MMIEGIYDGFRRNPFSRPGQPGAEQRDDQHGATLGRNGCDLKARRRCGPAECGRA